MRLHILATAFAAVAALSFATPAPAVTVPIDYTLLATDGADVLTGTMTLDYDGSLYSLESLDLTFRNSTKVATSFVALSPVSGGDYCLYSLGACSIASEQGSFYLIFDPSLSSQTDTAHIYSTDLAAEETFSVTIDRAAVPEPATWALMLLGFAAIGASMRWRRRRTVPLAV